jgi:phage shock protein C
MFCTKCGIELKERDKFCSDCGNPTGRGSSAPTPRVDRLSRPMHEAKLGGVCAGFARYFGIDVTLVRILWVVLTVLPVPFCGGIAYIVCWIVMPKDELPIHAPKGTDSLTVAAR